MSYRLTRTQTPGDGLRRVAAEELQDAIDGLTAAGTGPDRATAVHEARKCLKKTRSLVRLARPVLGDKRYRRINAELRDTARTLSQTRDADVLIAVVDDLQERFVGRLPAASFAALRDSLQAPPADPSGVGEGDPVLAAIGQLTAAREAIDAWPLDDATWKTVTSALATGYARGAKDLAVVRKDPASDLRHEWRKRVKDLWYQQRLITDAWEPVLEAQAEAAHRLSELLGDDHDLALLEDAIGSGRADAGADAAELLELVAHRREELLAEALDLGRRVYAEPPKAFARRTAAYIAAWAAPRPADAPAPAS